MVGDAADCGATPWLFYATLEPLFSHALSATATAVLVWQWLRARTGDRTMPWFVTGLAVGIGVARPLPGRGAPPRAGARSCRRGCRRSRERRSGAGSRWPRASCSASHRSWPSTPSPSATRSRPATSAKDSPTGGRLGCSTRCCRPTWGCSGGRRSSRWRRRPRSMRPRGAAGRMRASALIVVAAQLYIVGSWYFVSAGPHLRQPDAGELHRVLRGRTGGGDLVDRQPAGAPRRGRLQAVGVLLVAVNVLLMCAVEPRRRSAHSGRLD